MEKTRAVDVQAVREVNDALNDMVRRAIRESATIELSQDFGNFRDPYQVAVNTIKRILQHVESFGEWPERLLNHIHKFDDEGFCDVCGYDGNA